MNREIAELKNELDELRRFVYEMKRVEDAYSLLPKRKWWGHEDGPLYSETRKVFYSTLRTAKDSLLPGQSLADLHLVLCIPVHCSRIDYDFFAKDLGRNPMPPELAQAIDEFNEKTKRLGPLSWKPAKVAFDLSEEEKK